VCLSTTFTRRVIANLSSSATDWSLVRSK
jgi:hypothetical protein